MLKSFEFTSGGKITDTIIFPFLLINEQKKWNSYFLSNYTPLRAALYACFDALSNSIIFQKNFKEKLEIYQKFFEKWLN